jgi:rhamnulokinase
LIPDLLIYFLTGIRCSEFTNATTTQMFDPVRRDWARELLKKLSIPDRLFTEVVYPGTVLGKLDAGCQFKPGLTETRVVAVAQHDTASAVMGVPAKDEDFAYISSGTWSLLGTELKSPVINEKTFSFNFTNEGGAFGTWRLLKNVMGLWILQECQRHWAAEREYDFAQLEQAAESAAPFQCLIDPDDERFVPPGDMPGRIRAYCRETGQPQPETVGEVVRCVLESLALKYMVVFEQLEEITQKQYSAVYIMGGGVRNRLLCQFTAQATGKTVLTGPAEATAVGNLMVQAASCGEVKGIGEIREVIRRSFAVAEFLVDARSDWSEARDRFRALLRRAGKNRDNNR